MSSYPTVLKNESIMNRADDVSAAEAPLRLERSDNQLVDLVLAGDETAFEQLFDRHKRLVAMIGRRYFRRPEEIEEVIQISFAKMFTELGKFRGIHDRSLSSWLVRITSNVCFDILRSQKRKPESLSCELSDHENDVLLDLTAKDPNLAETTIINSDLVDKLLGRLSGDDRALLRMMYAEEMTIADIADALGWTRSNVKIRAWRARASLRKLLQRYL